MSTNKLNWLITAIIISIIFGIFGVRTIYVNIQNREGKVLYSSESYEELKSKTPFDTLDSENIQSCKWYEQISRKDGFFFIFTYLCYDGSLVLGDNYYESILSDYKWNEYIYPTSSRYVTNEDVYGAREIYGSSMIKESLKTKTLYTCDKYNMSFDSGAFYTFLDKETQTLYFYYSVI